MQLRVLIAVASILAVSLFMLASFALAQPMPCDLLINYYQWPCEDDLPMCTGTCWTGTPIPDGPSVNVYKASDNSLIGEATIVNGTFYSMPGFFIDEASLVIDVTTSLDVYAKVCYMGCCYTSIVYTLVPGPTLIETCQEEWTCDCGPSCTPTEEGSDGPYDISMDSTKVFFAAHDSCTVWVTAQGGTAHGVTVEVFDAVPGFHPVAFNYMSRIAAVYWDGSADPLTSLAVRMYYKTEELWESGFTGASCLIAARFDEFATHWSPILPYGSSANEKYIEFVTDRSGYFTFDCRGTAPRAIPIGAPTISSGDRELVVRWQTRDEFENYRFHILRAEKSEGPYLEIATVNSQLPDIGTTASYNYEYRDPGLENGRTYYYRLSSEDLHGNTVDGLAAVSGVPSLYGDAVQIDEYRLHAAYPNPFNPETRITYDVRDAGRVTLCVFDILGREVARLVDSEQPRGRYSVNFNAKDLPSGLYFYRIDIGGQFTSTQKMLLLK